MAEIERFYALDADSFGAHRRFADESAGEKEYYHAILDGRQRGRVFADDARSPRAVLFWHYAGFAFVAGTPDGAFLESVRAMLLRTHPYFTEDTSLQHRFILQQDDPGGDGFFDAAPDVLRSERLCFRYADGARSAFALPQGYALRPIDATVLPLLNGDVTPAFSWSSDAEFLRCGAGVVVLHGTEPAAWAFAAALGGGRMDVGVETAPPYRGKGLASAAARAMAQTAQGMGYAPVWGCDVTNEASARTALRAGFTPYCRHGKYKKKTQLP